jgi:hypothetical protein
MPPMPEDPATSVLVSSIKSAFEQTTMIGTPDGLCVNVPGPSGSKVDDKADVAGSGSLEDSAKWWRCDCTKEDRHRDRRIPQIG